MTDHEFSMENVVTFLRSEVLEVDLALMFCEATEQNLFTLVR